MRYDGYKLRVIRQEAGKPDGLQSDQVTSLLEDREGNLWVGTVNAGFHRFDRATERFVNFRFNPNDANSLSDNDVWGLFEDSKGYLWIGTKKGLNRFDPKTNSFLRIFAPTNGSQRPPSDYIYSICETPDGSIWSATTRGIDRIKFRDDSDYDLRHYELDPTAKDVALDNFIYRIRPALQEANTLWLGTKAGLKKIRFSDTDLSFLQITTSYRAAPGNPSSLSHNIVSDFWEEPNGNLWVATYHGFGKKCCRNAGNFAALPRQCAVIRVCQPAFCRAEKKPFRLQIGGL
jgi:ligand-binding sensor domain-containing protein